MSRVSIGSQAVVSRLESRFSEKTQAYVKQTKWKNPETKKAVLYQLQQISRDAFMTLRGNVAVNGAPWDYTLKNDDTAPRDRDLSSQLKAIQLEVYELITRTAEYRRKHPTIIDKTLRDCPRIQLPNIPDQSMEETDLTQEVSSTLENLLDRLKTAMAKISDLSLSLPQCKASLETLSKAIEIEVNNLSLPDDNDKSFDEGSYVKYGSMTAVSSKGKTSSIHVDISAKGTNSPD
eukprot:gene10651-2765_t